MLGSSGNMPRTSWSSVVTSLKPNATMDLLVPSKARMHVLCLESEVFDQVLVWDRTSAVL